MDDPNSPEALAALLRGVPDPLRATPGVNPLTESVGHVLFPGVMQGSTYALQHAGDQPPQPPPDYVGKVPSSAPNPYLPQAALDVGTGLDPVTALMGAGKVAATVAGKLAPAIFAGAGSATADAGKLGVAKWMEANAKPMESIFAKTGWFRHPVDGEWRNPISDAGSSWLPNSDKYSTVSGVLSHPELFRAYPELADIRVTRNLPAGRGYYMPGDDEGIELPSHGQEPPDNLRSIVLHELTHAIQQREGFAKGGDAQGIATILRGMSPGLPPAAYANSANNIYRRLAGETEARTVEKMANMPANAPPWMHQDVGYRNQLLGPATLNAQDWIKYFQTEYPYKLSAGQSGAAVPYVFK